MPKVGDPIRYRMKERPTEIRDAVIDIVVGSGPDALYGIVTPSGTKSMIYESERLH